MANIPAADLHDYQADILFNSDTATNPKLAYSAVPTLNKALKTSQKRPIRAINELYDAVQQNNSTVSSMNNSLNNVMGDVASNPDVIADLNKISPDAISAIIVLYKMIAGPNLDAPVDISQFANSVHGAVNILSKDLKALQDKVDNLSVSGGGGGMDSSFLVYL